MLKFKLSLCVIEWDNLSKSLSCVSSVKFLFPKENTNNLVIFIALIIPVLWFYLFICTKASVSNFLFDFYCKDYSVWFISRVKYTFTQLMNDVLIFYIVCPSLCINEIWPIIFPSNEWIVHKIWYVAYNSSGIRYISHSDVIW